MQLIRYSKTRLAIIGDCRQFRSELIEAGGKFNNEISYKGKIVKGWVFNIKKQTKVNILFTKINKEK